MTEFEDFSIKVKNFKCFGDEPQGFDSIKRVNLIIGRNNSGKSSLLDLIQYACDQNQNWNFPPNERQKSKDPEVIGFKPVSEEELQESFSHNHGIDFTGTPMQYAASIEGHRIHWSLSGKELLPIKEHKKIQDLRGHENGNSYLSSLGKAMKNPLSIKGYRRIVADRDIASESKKAFSLSENGAGATTIIKIIINQDSHDRNLVKRDLLHDLNTIFSTDAHFTDIFVQTPNHDGEIWAIYLREEGKGEIPLSQSGSGLKTVILVLICIRLIPYIENKPLKDYVFAFEELENNLHPALLRRLLSYLYDKARKHDFTMFLTSHSNVAIDFFSRREDAQIVHVTHDGEQSYCKTVQTYVDNKGILDDLDVRASDLLQANCIIWVEGPSDRIYVNRWIELWSSGELREGQHYQCMFYGGRLLSHLESKEPEQVESGIAILNISRNAIFLIDSDKKSRGTRINATKKRIQEEVSKMGGLTWVTKGREIENYIPVDAVSALIESSEKVSIGQYDDFFDCLDKMKRGEGKSYRSKKPLMAERICPHLTKENLEGLFDLNEQLGKICKKIKEWNGV